MAAVTHRGIGCHNLIHILNDTAGGCGGAVGIQQQWRDGNASLESRFRQRGEMGEDGGGREQKRSGEQTRAAQEYKPREADMTQNGNHNVNIVTWVLALSNVDDVRQDECL